MNVVKWKRREHAVTSAAEYVAETFKDFKDGREKSDFYQIKDLDKAFNLLALFKYRPVRIICDYDTDGMCSTIGINFLLKELNFTDVKWYIPDRELDGYGASPDIVDYLCNNKSIHNRNAFKTIGTGLLITIDNGITALNAIQRAKELGWAVLILDHHLAITDENENKVLPPADVIIDPHAVDCGAMFSDYCGAGLVYKFAQFIKNAGMPGWTVSDETFAKITGVAAIATVGDSVSFIEEINGIYGYDNYLIVKNGLFQLTQNAGRTTGMYCLLVGVNSKFNTIITAEDIGFTISPIMNATSRLCEYGSDKVVDLFLQDDNEFINAAAKAKVLVENNNLRKQYTDQLIPILKERIEAAHMENDYPLIVCSKPDEIHPGVIGLVAGKLQEEYHTAVIVFAPTGDGTIYKGSARAPEDAGINIKELLDKTKEYLIAYGGHPSAAGISGIKAENIKPFTEAIQKAAGKKPECLFNKYYDFEIDSTDTESEYKNLQQYAPFGHGFEEPLYKISFETKLNKGVYYQLLGAEKRVLKLLGNGVNAINFNGLVDKYSELGTPTIVTLYGRVGENVFNGITTPQIMFEDIDF